MKRALVVLVGALALAACPGGETRVFTASYSLTGGLRGSRAVDDQSGGRVSCTLDVDPSDPLDPSPVFTLAVLGAGDGSRGPGVYLSLHGWRGVGAYQLGTGSDQGKAVAFDGATLTDCGRDGDLSCFMATKSCSLVMETWALGAELPPGVKTGTATGSFTCDSLEQTASAEKARITTGTFTCRATDWTASRR